MSASLSLPTLPLAPPPDLQPQSRGEPAGPGETGGGDWASHADAFAASLEANDSHGMGQGGTTWADTDPSTDFGSSILTKFETLAQSDNGSTSLAPSDSNGDGVFSTSFQSVDGTEAGSNVIGRMPGIEATDNTQGIDAHTQQFVNESYAIGKRFVMMQMVVSTLGGAQNIVNTALKMQ